MTDKNSTAETGAKKSLLLWMLPYLAVSGCVLGLLSWAVGTFLLPQIPLWNHLVAVAAALSILAATLYALSKTGLVGHDQQ